MKTLTAATGTLCVGAFTALILLWVSSFGGLTNEYSLFYSDQDVASGDGPQAITAPTGRMATVFGRVRHSSGDGMQNARLRITGANYSGPEYTFTDRDGRYAFKNVPEGELFVVSVRANGQSFPIQSRELMAGSPEESIDFVAK